MTLLIFSDIVPFTIIPLVLSILKRKIKIKKEEFFNAKMQRLVATKRIKKQAHHKY